MEDPNETNFGSGGEQFLISYRHWLYDIITSCTSCRASVNLTIGPGRTSRLPVLCNQPYSTVMLLKKYFYRLSVKSAICSIVFLPSSWTKTKISSHNPQIRPVQTKSISKIAQYAERPQSCRACYTRDMPCRFLIGSGMTPLVLFVIAPWILWLMQKIHFNYRLETARPLMRSRLLPYSNCARDPV